MWSGNAVTSRVSKGGDSEMGWLTIETEMLRVKRAPEAVTMEWRQGRFVSAQRTTRKVEAPVHL